MALAEQIDSTTPGLPELVRRAEALAPKLKERARDTEQRRTLPVETMRDLFDTGLLRILQPRRHGGYEMGWAAHADVARVLSRTCASTAWIVSVVGAHAAIVGRMGREFQDEVWGKNQNQLIATASARTQGGARKVDGGYRVTGLWHFASGVDHSEWSMITAPVEGNDPKDHSKFVRLAAPTSAIEIVDSWHVSGMRGTGSKDMKWDDVFVPEHRAINAHQSFGKSPPGAAVNPGGYLYEVEFMPYFGSSLLGPMLGTAEGAYADYREITRVRTGALFGGSVAEQTPVQQRLAESAAEIKAARLIYETNNAMMHAKGQARQRFSAEEMLEINRDRAYVARLCVNAVTRLVRQMGAMGLFDNNPVQRHYRDMTTMATQVAVNWDRGMNPFGAHQLGVAVGPDARISPAEPIRKH
jgi:3-hydroxy-9,10-secoandrosta-1,3,5(10)-triene-9,17-dione monooxygenase